MTAIELLRSEAASLYRMIGVDLETRKHQTCPFPDHDDRHPSFRIDGDKWICTCGHGDVVDAIRRVNGMSVAEAVRWGAERVSSPECRPVAAIKQRAPSPTPSESSTARYARELWGRVDRNDQTIAAHPYCQKKLIYHAFGAGRARASGSIIGKDADCVVIPVKLGGIGEVIAVQCVNAEGKKQTFGSLGDAFLLLGNEADPKSRWFVLEGWASAHAVFTSIRNSVVLIAFGKGRMDRVAETADRIFAPQLIQVIEDA